MRQDDAIMKQLKIILGICVGLAAVTLALGMLDLVRGVTVLIWSVFLLGFVAIGMLLGTFALHRLTPARIYLLTGAYWLLILLAMIFISGIHTRQTLHLQHDTAISVQDDLDNLFSQTLALEKQRDATGSLIGFVKTKNGTDIEFYRSQDLDDSGIEPLLKRIGNSRDKSSLVTELVILEGDDPRMYQYSGLQPGDRVKVEVNWLGRQLQRSASAALMLGARDCNIHLPLHILDSRIRIPLSKDPQLTQEKLGVGLSELTEDEKNIAQELFMVAHKFEFTESGDNGLFDRLQYDGAAALILTASTIKGGEQLASDCDNSHQQMLQLALTDRDPYMVRLMFPQLSQGLQQWELQSETEFVGLVQMFRRFPDKLQELF